MKRYQECNTFTKIWRCRWYLAVPFYSIYLWITRSKIYEDEIDEINNSISPTGEYEIMSLRMCWDIAIGSIQSSKLKYYYTTEEVFGKLKDKINED